MTVSVVRRTRRVLLALATTALLAVPATPAALARPATGSPGGPPGHQALDRAALKAALQGLDAGGAVGAVAQLRVPGDRWSGAAGVSDQRTGRPARTWDTTRIASITKPMVATLVLQEVQRGRWTLHTTVGQVWPGLLPGHDAVTLEQLLSHRSGAPDFLAALLADVTTEPEFMAAISRPRTDHELVAAANTLPWLFTPGTDFAYSNTNYVVLGMLLAKVNHQSLARLLQRRVFWPAGMYGTRYETGVIRGRHLAEYAVLETGAPLTALPRFQGSMFGPAGAMVAPMGDVNAFFRALFTGRLLSPRLVADMQRPRTTGELPYGLGLLSLPDPCGPPGAQLIGHDGASFGTISLALSTPDARRQLAVSFTGRDDADTTLEGAYQRFVVTALGQGCAAPAPGTRAASTWTVPTLDR